MREITVFIFIIFQLLQAPSFFAQKPEFPTDSKVVYDVCFSPHGEVIAIADKQSIKFYNFDERVIINEFKGGHNDQIMTVEISPDSTLVVSGAKDGKVVVWQLKTGDVLHTFDHHKGIVTSVSVSSNGRYMASAATDNTVLLYDLHDLSIIKEFGNHEDDVMVVKFSPDSKLLASGGGDGYLSFYDVYEKKLITTIKGHNDWIRGLDFDPDTTFLISVGDDGIISWNISDLNRVFIRNKFDKPGHWKTSIGYMGAKQTYVVSSIRGIIYVFSPLGAVSNNLQVPVHKVINRPNQSIYYEIVAATRGRGVLVFSGKDFE